MFPTCVFTLGPWGVLNAATVFLKVPRTFLIHYINQVQANHLSLREGLKKPSHFIVPPILIGYFCTLCTIYALFIYCRFITLFVAKLGGEVNLGNARISKVPGHTAPHLVYIAPKNLFCPKLAPLTSLVP